jgi:hypothetical protein
MFTRLEWEEKAACKGAPVEIFFPEINGDKTDNPWLPARNYCAQCTVKKQCLDAALKYEQPVLMRFGMWGGQTPTERGVTASKRGRKTYNL